MKSITYFSYISIFYIWILFTTTKVIAAELPITNNGNNIVNILMDKPDDFELYKISMEEYNTKMNEFLNKKINDVEVKFSFNPNESVEKKTRKEYEDYVKYIIEQLNTSNYDMMILDDKFLFSDLSNIESSYIRDTFNEKNIHKYFVNLSELFKSNNDKMKNNDAFDEAFKNVFSYSSDKTDNEHYIYDEDMVKGGFNNNILYGLPYAIDLDLWYINNDNENVNDEYLLVNLADDDRLLSTFVNYLITKGKNNDDKVDYDVFKKYMENGNLDESLINSFRQYIGNSVSKDFNVQFESLTLDSILKIFKANRNDYHHFFGKSSQYCSSISSEYNGNSLMNVTDIFLFNGKAVRNKKYLVINKNSRLDKNILFEVALQLTQSEAQTLNFSLMCRTPAYDFNVIEPNIPVQPSFINALKQQSNFVNIKKIFESEFSAPYMEIRAFLPDVLKKNLKEGQPKPVVDTLENIHYLVLDRNSNKDVSIYLFYAPMVVFTLICIAIIGLVIKYREHPRIKVLSPGLCILIIIGYTIDIPLTPYFLVQQPSVTKCKLEFVESILDSSLIMFPMVAITYRIYSIYNNTSKVVIGKRLKDGRILIILEILIFFSVIAAIILAFFVFHFYLKSYGNISTYRHQTCDFNESDMFSYIEYGTFFVLVNIYLNILILLIYLTL